LYFNPIPASKRAAMKPLLDTGVQVEFILMNKGKKQKQKEHFYQNYKLLFDKL
jgi:hypothetical protein